MRLRVLGTVVVAALSITGLAGCQTKVGQAAVVGGHQISESELGKYVTRSGPTKAVQDAAAGQQQSIEPKVQALATLIEDELFRQALDRTGSVPTSAQLGRLHDEAVQRFFQSSVGGDQFDAQLVKQAQQYGFTSRFAQLVVHSIELEDALVNRTKATSVTELAASVNKLHLGVSVSPRYGKWNAKALTLSNNPGAGLPSFVKFGAGATSGTSSAPQP